MTKALETEARRRIYAYLRSAPGSHFSQVQRELEMATGTLQYHLRYMERKSLIEIKQDGKYTRYFPSMEVDRRHKAALGLLRQPTPRAVVLDLVEHGASRLNDLSARTGTPASTLSFHLKKLVKAEVVAKVERGVYDVADPDAIVALLAEYRAGFLDAAVDRVVRLFTGVKPVAAGTQRPSDGTPPTETAQDAEGTREAGSSETEEKSGSAHFAPTRRLWRARTWNQFVPLVRRQGQRSRGTPRGAVRLRTRRPRCLCDPHPA